MAQEQESSEASQSEKAYWRANPKVIAILMSIWALTGLLMSIVFVEPLNAFKLGGFPFGFWMAQQGTIYVFIVLIYVYARWMEKIDKQFGVDEGDQ